MAQTNYENQFNRWSASAQLFDNLAIRKLLIPKFNGQYLAQVYAHGNLPENPHYEIFSRIEDKSALNVYFYNIGFDDIGWDLLKNLDQILYLDIASRINSPRMLNDTSRIHSNVVKAENGLAKGLSQNYNGNNVLVGIVDIGFQTDHPTFFSADESHYKIQRFWNQQSNGVKPTAFNYGAEYKDSSSIVNAIDDDGTHGTHVAGIAAGSGLGSPNLKYRGMAPKADLALVGIKYSNDTLGGSGLGDYVIANSTILDGYQYIFKYAEQIGKPSVINLSWGMHTGPHDGTSLFDKTVNSLVGSGRILVGAAGNDGNNQMHIHKDLNGDTAYVLAVDNNRKDFKRENIYADIWSGVGNKMKIQVSLVDTVGKELLLSPFNYAGDCINCGAYKNIYTNGYDSLWIIWTEQNYAFNGKSNMLLIIEQNHPNTAYIRLAITSTGEFNAWNSGQAYRWTSGHFWKGHKGSSFGPKYIEGSAIGSVGENGGSGINMLTAGAYINRNEWFNYKGEYQSQKWNTVGDIAGFSSRGPMPKSQTHPNGRIKPDIIAPGQMIASALHRRQVPGWLDNGIVHKDKFKGNDVYWALFSGTSMAAPHATGIVALYLQANEWLTPPEIRNLWRLTARKDQFTGTDSNGNAGYGKIDAFSTLSIIDQYSNIPKNDKKMGWTYFLNKQNHWIIGNIQGQEIYGIDFYNNNGQILTAGINKIFTETSHNLEFDLSHLPKGVYYFRAIRANNTTLLNGKILLVGD